MIALKKLIPLGLPLRLMTLAVSDIKPGDPRTTSSTLDRPMKVSDHAKAQGAILGKAMTGLSEGKGMVLVLVTLQ